MNRIRQLRKEKGITMKELGSYFNLSESSISLYETGKRLLDQPLIEKFSAFFEVSADYLLGISNIKKLPSENSDSNSGANNSNVIPMKQPLTNGGKIKVLGSVPAGVPVEAVECVIDEIDISEKMAADSNEYFGLLVSGDSMFPEYLDGDIVIVRKQSTAETGDDVVAYVNSYDATLKRLQVMSGGIRLKALNPQYESKFYSNDDVINMPVSILGVVVEMRRTKK